jgi:hypothetical protein
MAAELGFGLKLEAQTALESGAERVQAPQGAAITKFWQRNREAGSDIMSRRGVPSGNLGSSRFGTTPAPIN